MNDRTLYKDEVEAKQHQSAILNLAENLHRSEIVVRPLYEIVLSRFNRTARIRDFLTVLVSRRVKDLMNTTEHVTIDGKRHGSHEL